MGSSSLWTCLNFFIPLGFGPLRLTTGAASLVSSSSLAGSAGWGSGYFSSFLTTYSFTSSLTGALAGVSYYFFSYLTSDAFWAYSWTAADSVAFLAASGAATCSLLSSAFFCMAWFFLKLGSYGFLTKGFLVFCLTSTVSKSSSNASFLGAPSFKFFADYWFTVPFYKTGSVALLAGASSPSFQLPFLKLWL